jgi:RNA-directed DNA polymerase
MKSALDAVGVTRQRCWKYDWVLEFDIKGLFDNLPHDLLLKAVRKDVKCNWALLYIERWLTAPMEKNGEVIERTRGTPQGGVVSPILSNLFLHYAFDVWMTRTHPDLPWCRYADDGLVHCRTEQEAEALMVELQARLAECGLQMHPTKTHIVYKIIGAGKCIRLSNLTSLDTSSGRDRWRLHSGMSSSVAIPQRPVRRR